MPRRHPYRPHLPSQRDLAALRLELQRQREARRAALAARARVGAMYRAKGNRIPA